MSLVRLPDGFRLERLRRDHPRGLFRSGEPRVDDWLATKAFQQQRKQLSTTKVLLDEVGSIAGYFTLAIGEVEFEALPFDLTSTLPHRALPVVILAWLGVATDRQGQGLGRILLGQALQACHQVSQLAGFVAVILDCISDAAKTFYERWDFKELPGYSHRLYLSTQWLHAMMEDD